MAIRTFVSVSVGAAILITVTTAQAQDKPKPLAPLQQCRTLADPAARVACYDRAVDALTAAEASGQTVVIDRDQVRRARKGLFGFTMPRIPFLTGRAGNAEDAADESELATTVVSSRTIGYGKWRFTVEGGGVWETTESSIAFDDPVPGAKIVLRKGSLGGYFAKVGNGRLVRAKRVG